MACSIVSTSFLSIGSLYHFPDLPGEVCKTKGLLEKPVAAAIHNLLRLAFNAVPAGQKNLDPGIDLPETIKGFPSRYPSPMPLSTRGSYPAGSRPFTWTAKFSRRHSFAAKRIPFLSISRGTLPGSSGCPGVPCRCHPLQCCRALAHTRGPRGSKNAGHPAPPGEPLSPGLRSS